MATWLILICIIILISNFCTYSQRAGAPTPNATSPFWLLNAQYQNYRSTQSLPTEADVVIIGAGISGVSVAYHLTVQYKQKNVVLLDARGVCAGASGRNGGVFQTLSPEEYTDALNKYNSSTTATNINNWYIDAVNYYYQLAQKYNVDIEVINNETIFGYTDPSETQSVNQSIQIMHSYNQGLDFELVLSPQINDISLSPLFVGATMMKNNDNNNLSGYLHPTKLMFKLVNVSLETNNLNLQTQTLVTSVTRNILHPNYEWIINTENRGQIFAKTVVFATNGYSSYLLPEYESNIVPVRNQLIASIALDITIWNPSFANSANHDFEYYHQRDIDNRIIIGGGRDNVSQSENMWYGNYNDSFIDQNISYYLQSFLSKYYPIINQNIGPKIDIFMEWAGILGMSNDGLPWIGPLVNKINAFICAGYTGNGIINPINAGKNIAQMIMNETPQPFDDHFLPSSRAKLV